MSALTFKHPGTVLLAGPTGCGKTQFLVDMLRLQMIEPPPERIIIVFGEWQDAYEKIKVLYPSTEFVQSFDETMYESLDKSVRNMVVLDDQMVKANMIGEEAAAFRSTVSRLFAQGSHHRNLTVVYIVQNLFDQARCMRGIALNTQYLVIFKSPRDMSQIRTLGQQMYPAEPHHLLAVFEDATEKPFGHLVMDMRPQTPEILRLRTCVFSKNPVCYARSGSSKVCCLYKSQGEFCCCE